MEEQKAQKPEVVAVKLLEYLFEDIKYEYYQLTPTEKKLCNEDEFHALLHWMDLVKRGLA